MLDEPIGAKPHERSDLAGERLETHHEMHARTPPWRMTAADPARGVLGSARGLRKRRSTHRPERKTVNRTTNHTKKRTTNPSIIAVGLALALALVPGTAFASSDDLSVAAADFAVAGVDAGEVVETADEAQGDLAASEEGEAQTGGEEDDATATTIDEAASQTVQAAAAFVSQASAKVQEAQQASTDKVLSYDRADIEAIGTQEQTGHSICCPSFSCAYADAVLDGTVHDHSYYTCSCCTWPDWGSGESSFRCVGTDEQLLREAYDEIAAGRPTVIHVSAGYGEHWIALIGYTGATDPDHLTLANFIALDPWDGAQIVASDRFSLYGDGCEHVSDR